MAEATIYKYLVDGNRPYSIQNLIDAFKSQGIAKAQLTRILDGLVASSSIMLIVRAFHHIYLFVLYGTCLSSSSLLKILSSMKPWLPDIVWFANAAVDSCRKTTNRKYT